MVWKNAQAKQWRERAEAVIPGGMYGHESVALLPEEFPQFYRRSDGAHIWDMDDNRYVDWMCAFGPNLFGYRNQFVDAAALAQYSLGDTMTGPSHVMVEFAEAMVRQITHADWVMFCKNGSDATTMACTLARAHTGRRKIILAHGAYHGASPWCTPVAKGVVPEARAHQIACVYDDPQSLAEAIQLAGSDLAAIIATPFRHEVFEDQSLPNLAYAALARQVCDETGALLIVDDVRAGFRMARDCSWSTIGVQPDLSTWGKAIANGHPISALAGSEKARKAATEIFVTGSYWFSAVPMAAGIATLKLIETTDYLEHSIRIGALLRQGLDGLSQSYGFRLRQTGPVQMPQILFESDDDFGLGFRWTAEALRHGAYLHPWHNMFVCAAHSEQDVQVTLDAADRGFSVLKNLAKVGRNTIVSDYLAKVGTI